MNLLIHVENHDRVGILPSQLESIRLLATAMGIERMAFVDATWDGVLGEAGWERYPSFKRFLELAEGPLVMFTSNDSAPLLTKGAVPADAWLMFGPAMGWTKEDLNEKTQYRLPIPLALNSRDIVPIVLWELAK